ncbi:hypothetical protein HRbin27_02057 [bacterium HR27]|nr:hypothetical protein HRbin27_02057 [bacterium HR27]
MESFAREGQDGSEQHLDRVDRAQGDEDRRRRCLPILADLEPRCLFVQVTVDFAGERHRLALRRFELDARIEVTDALETGRDLLEQDPVASIEVAGFRHATLEAVLHERQDTMDEIPPRRQELVVVAFHEPLPGELAVARLRRNASEVVAQRIRRVPREKVRNPDSPIAAGRELLPFEVQELVRRDVVGQVERLVIAHEFSRPDDGMERDIVLTDEIVAPC